MQWHAIASCHIFRSLENQNLHIKLLETLGGFTLSPPNPWPPLY